MINKQEKKVTAQINKVIQLRYARWTIQKAKRIIQDYSMVKVFGPQYLSQLERGSYLRAVKRLVDINRNQEYPISEPRSEKSLLTEQSEKKKSMEDQIEALLKKYKSEVKLKKLADKALNIFNFYNFIIEECQEIKGRELSGAKIYWENEFETMLAKHDLKVRKQAV